MAVSLTYPATLPLPLLSGYSLGQQPGLSVTTFSTGMMRARQLPNRPSRMKATWRLNEADAELFEAALEHWLLGRWFVIRAKLPRAQRIQEVEALIVKDPRDSRKPTASSFDHWDYSAELLIKPLPQIDEGTMLDQLLYPDTFSGLLADLEISIKELP